ncbi:hypothetical protein O9992_24280 [Vibrio lentus]|nr:hypothetical protein [Vibrio lentus]
MTKEMKDVRDMPKGHYFPLYHYHHFLYIFGTVGIFDGYLSTLAWYAALSTHLGTGTELLSCST